MRSIIGLAAVTFVVAVGSLSAARINNPVIQNQYGTGQSSVERRPENQFVSTVNAMATRRAKAVLDSKSGSTVSGEVTFTEKQGGVEISIKVKGATPGPHGVHLHENGDCAAADAQSAGGHFNPDKTAHGAPHGAVHHGGDLGNMTVRANGAGELKLTVKGLTVSEGAHSVVGRAFIVHAGADDLKSQPAGNSGARFACGVVKATS